MSKSQNKKADYKSQLSNIKEKLAASIGISLFSHPVARALSSAPLSLTSVFGMGTGGPSASSTPIKLQRVYGSPNWARTSDIMINSHALSHMYFHTSYCTLHYLGVYLIIYRCVFLVKLSGTADRKHSSKL